MITTLPFADMLATPWKNGGGLTREIAAFPPGAGMDTFLWRISMAEVSATGPFSHFEGVDRHLTVLRGQLRLDFPDGQCTLNPFDSQAFAGDIPVLGTPLESPVTDLNVMTRRGLARADVQSVSGRVEIRAPVVILIDQDRLDATVFEDETGRTITTAPSLMIALN